MERLIIFTRYPEPGKTKTRMIPALGAEGAAKLQRQLTEHTLEKAQLLKKQRNLSVEIHFTGGNQQLMQEWLGSDWLYRQQSDGDLGAKMQSALALTLGEGIKRAVIIGTDCPALNVSILCQAFESLKTHDLVIGSAADGGYYLIGLSSVIPQLFQGINWGTASVFSSTVSIAQQLSLSCAYLPELQDLDRPEDLTIWQQVFT